MIPILTYLGAAEIPIEYRSKEGFYFVDCMEEAEKLLDGREYLFVMIDLEGGEEEGLQIAYYIRRVKKYKLIPILFFAGDNKYKELAFHDIHCYDFIIKPIREIEIMQILNLFLARNSFLQEKTHTTFRIKKVTHVVKICDIIFVEAINRYVIVHTVEGILKVPYLNLRSCLDSCNGMLVQCHRAFAVNMNFIKTIDGKSHKIVLRENLGSIDVGRKFEPLLRLLFDE